MTEQVQEPIVENQIPPQDTPPNDPPADPPPADPPVDPPKELNLDPVEVEETGDATLDKIGALLKEKNIQNANAMLKQIVKDGELDLGHKAELVEQLGEGTARLVIEQMEGVANAAKETAKQERVRLMEYAKEVFKEEDAEATWKAVQEFARSEASGFSDAELTDMNKMLQAGGLQAEMVIDRIATVYERSTGYTQEADLLNGDAPVTSGFTPIGSREYAEQVRELIGKYGEESQQVKALRAQRQRSQQMGIA